MRPATLTVSQRLQLFFGFAVVLGKQRFGPVLRLDVVGKSNASSAQGCQLALPLNNQLVFILGGGLRRKRWRNLGSHEQVSCAVNPDFKFLPVHQA